MTALRRAYCRLVGIVWTLRTLNLFTPLGAIPVEGHEFVEEESYIDGDRLVEPLRCERCGTRELLWRRVYQ